MYEMGFHLDATLHHSGMAPFAISRYGDISSAEILLRKQLGAYEQIDCHADSRVHLATGGVMLQNNKCGNYFLRMAGLSDICLQLTKAIKMDWYRCEESFEIYRAIGKVCHRGSHRKPNTLGGLVSLSKV